MCLAVPAQIISITENSNPLQRMARVDFSGVFKEISLAYLPEANEGDYVIVHAGLALSLIDEMQAKETLALFDELAQLSVE